MYIVPTPSAADAATAYLLWWERHASAWHPGHHVPVMAWVGVVYRAAITDRKRRGGYLLTLQYDWLLACIDREFPDLGIADSVGGITVAIDRDRWPELADAAEAAANAFAAYYTEAHHKWRLDMIPESRRDAAWPDEYAACLTTLDALDARGRRARRAYNDARSAAWGGSSTPPAVGAVVKAAKPRGPKPAPAPVVPRGTVTECWFCEPTNGHHAPGCMMAAVEGALA